MHCHNLGEIASVHDENSIAIALLGELNLQIAKSGKCVSFKKCRVSFQSPSAFLMHSIARAQQTIGSRDEFGLPWH